MSRTLGQAGLFRSSAVPRSPCFPPRRRAGELRSHRDVFGYSTISYESPPSATRIPSGHYRSVFFVSASSSAGGAASASSTGFARLPVSGGCPTGEPRSADQAPSAQPCLPENGPHFVIRITTPQHLPASSFSAVHIELRRLVERRLCRVAVVSARPLCRFVRQPVLRWGRRNFRESRTASESCQLRRQTLLRRARQNSASAAPKRWSTTPRFCPLCISSRVRRLPQPARLGPRLEYPGVHTLRSRPPHQALGPGSVAGDASRRVRKLPNVEALPHGIRVIPKKRRGSEVIGPISTNEATPEPPSGSAASFGT